MQRKPHLLALVEHVDRELDLLCLLGAELKARFGIDLQILNFYADAPLALNGASPDVVLTPFFYATEDVVLKDYVNAWPDATWLNFAWEQVFYPSQALIKRPRDAFTRNNVTHVAWSRDFLDYQVANGVAPERVELIGHGVYALYDKRRRPYFTPRVELARRYGLDPTKRWVFVPENYRWAFFADNKLKNLGARGVEADDLRAMRDYCRASMTDLIVWCEALTDTGDVEVIFRPRPATSVEEFSAFMKGVIGDRPPRFHLIKQESAREWVLASDASASSFSTVLIEAALAGRAAMRVEPRATPAALRYVWCDLLDEATSKEEFVALARSADASGAVVLRDWAEGFFFPCGDPVDNLLSMIATAASTAAAQPAPRAAANRSMRLTSEDLHRARTMDASAREAFFRQSVKGHFFNRGTHEKDMFDLGDVDAREKRWLEVLAASRELI
jgi:hypothetical protein